MLDLHRNWFKNLESKTANVFAVLPLTPNQYTALSIAAALATAWLMIAGDHWRALAMFLVSAGLDFVDGAVARRKNLASARGAYWDTVADRYVEAVFLFGLLFAGLPDFHLPAAAWIFLALFGSTMTTYAKAAAKEKGLRDTELKGGLMSRAERIVIYAAIVILLGFDADAAAALLALLAMLCNLTAIQRILAALRP